MKTLRCLLVLFSATILGCGNATDVSLLLDFADPGADGSSRINPIEFTTDPGDAGRARIELTVQSANGYSGSVDLRASLEGDIFDEENLDTAVIFNKGSSTANASNTPFDIEQGELLHFWVIIDPIDGSGDCATVTPVHVASIPAADFVDIYVRACAPPP